VALNTVSTTVLFTLALPAMSLPAPGETNTRQSSKLLRWYAKDTLRPLFYEFSLFLVLLLEGFVLMFLCLLLVLVANVYVTSVVERSDPPTCRSVLLLIVKTVVLLSAAAAATLHRRHLMVWQTVLATSAPKRSFDTLGNFHCGS
jgi:hypothetical protein